MLLLYYPRLEEPPMIRKPRVFYGWYIVGVMIVAMMLVYGIRTSFSSFFPHILDEFHWFRGTTAIMLSLNIFVYGLSAPVAGHLVDKWKPRAVVFIGIFLLAFGTAGCYFARELWHFYILFGILAPIGSAFCGSPVLNTAIINWFTKRRGLAVGLGQIGGGLSFVYVMLVDWVSTRWGWEYSFFVMAGLLIVIMAPLYLVFYHVRPEDKKIKAYGYEEPQSGALPGIVLAAKPDWTLRQAFGTYQLWLLVFADFCYWGIGNYLVIAHQIRFAEDVGYTSQLATSVLALFGLVSIVGQVGAFVSDFIGREKTALFAVVLHAGGFLALLSVHDASQPWLLYIYAICAGFATGTFSPTIIVSSADIFHGKNIGAISALLLTGVGFGGAIGPWLGGYIFDVSGSYHSAFIVSMVAVALAGVSLWIAAPRHAARLREKRLGAG
jgi:MFS family permease